jgi:hypothetical protein
MKKVKILPHLTVHMSRKSLLITLCCHPENFSFVFAWNRTQEYFSAADRFRKLLCTGTSFACLEPNYTLLPRQKIFDLSFHEIEHIFADFANLCAQELSTHV